MEKTDEQFFIIENYQSLIGAVKDEICREFNEFQERKKRLISCIMNISWQYRQCEKFLEFVGLWFGLAIDYELKSLDNSEIIEYLQISERTFFNWIRKLYEIPEIHKFKRRINMKFSIGKRKFQNVS